MHPEKPALEKSLSLAAARPSRSCDIVEDPDSYQAPAQGKGKGDES